MLKDTDLLNHIHQTTEMGQRGIDMVMDYAENPSLRDALQQQKAEYASMYRSADTMLRSRNVQPEKINTFAKLSSEISSSMKTMSDHSQSKIAEMMIQGNTKGMTKSIQCLNTYAGTDKEITSLAEKLLKTEEANIEQMKAFL
ncbi:MAG: DUF2383 domain-containing protein [Butyricicoccus sp.]